MTGLLMFFIRVALAVALYAFLYWALLSIWRDLRHQKAAIQNQQPPEIRLQIRNGAAVQNRVFRETEVTLGRDPACECVLASETISAQHARFTHHHGQWWAEDLKSTNGTRINGETLTTATVITPGDQITCGDLTLIILEE